MSIKTLKKIIFVFILLNICVSQGLAANQQRITFSVKALFKDHVMLEINGEQRLLSAGEESPEGIKLISSDAHEANLICHGKEFTLYINQSAYVGITDKGESSESNIPNKFNKPNKLVPGSTVAFSKENINNVVKYTLKKSFSRPSVMEDGQGAIWIGVGKELLRFDVEKEAWGVFDLSNDVNYRIDKLSVSDESIILNTAKMVKKKRRYSLSLFDIRTRDFHTQLDGVPGSYQFIGETLWFLDSSKGLGYVVPRKNNPNTKYKDALLYKEKPKDKSETEDKNKKAKVKNVYAKLFSANGDDIWYSHHSKYKSNDRKNRLNEVCVSRYNKKRKTLTRFTRKEVGLDEKINCSFLAVADDQVWLSHDHDKAGLSVFNMATKTWKRILSSANNMLIGGREIMLDRDQLLMIRNQQLISLNTKTLHANVVAGDAVINNQWQSKFHVSDGYAWYSVQEQSEKNRRKMNLVLYKIPINPPESMANYPSQ